MILRKVLIDSLTGIDNMTFDHSRILGVLSFIIYVALAVHSMFAGDAWTANQFSTGVSVMAVAFGINLRLKQPTEPSEKEDK